MHRPELHLGFGIARIAHGSKRSEGGAASKMSFAEPGPPHVKALLIAGVDVGLGVDGSPSQVLHMIM